LTNYITALKSDKKVTLHHIHLEGAAPFYAPENEPYFRGNTMFIGSNSRAAVREGRVDFIPVFLSEIPLLYRSRRLPLDVAFIHVSPPDQHGYCSLGVR
jgi:acyl-CoA hydrolase